MRIGELAEKVGVNVQTIRYYERRNLLDPPHRWPDTGHRDYDEEAERRLRFIQSAKEAGFSLREIRELIDLSLLPRESCEEVRALVEAKIREVDARMGEMRRMRKVLNRLSRDCSTREPDAACPALWEIGH